MAVLHTNAEIILGPPGTGKTTRMLSIVEDLLKQGLEPDEIGYFAFTKKAAEEAIDRAVQRFPQYSRQDFKFFRTIHSLCFRQLSMTRQQVLQRHHLMELGDKLGLEIKGQLSSFHDEEEFVENTVGDKIVFMESVARNRCVPLKQQWEESDSESVNFADLERFAIALKQFKESDGYIDYTDMLELFQYRAVRPYLRAVIIDEAQDLSLLQWKVIHECVKKADHVYVTGDDDQCIYRWAGAAVEYFAELQGRVSCLQQSYRTPRAIRTLSDGIISRNKSRRAKQWADTGREGRVDWAAEIGELPIGDTPGTWYLLARNAYFLKLYEEKCLEDGIPYTTHNGRSPVRSNTLRAIRIWTRLERGTAVSQEDAEFVRTYMSPRSPGVGIWHDALDRIPLREREFLIAALRRGESITGSPRVKIGTIHSVKGGECDHVAIILDMARQTYDGYQTDSAEDEHRTFYVGVTRARESCHFVEPVTSQSFEM